jgi:hypothetical protein
MASCPFTNILLLRSIEELQLNTGVIILSLGTEHTIGFCSKLNKEVKYNYLLPDGSFLYISQVLEQGTPHTTLFDLYYPTN